MDPKSEPNDSGDDAEQGVRMPASDSADNSNSQQDQPSKHAQTSKLKEGTKDPSERASVFQDEKAARYTVYVTVISTYLIPFMFISLHETDLKIAQIISEHFVVFVGLPWAGGAAAVIVLMYRFYSGEFVFKFLSFELRGGAAPAWLWVICFLACVLALKVLW